MIHVIIEDDIKGKYIHHNETLSGTELDALKSKNHSTIDVYELIADCWNSADFNPVTEVSDYTQTLKHILIVLISLFSTSLLPHHRK